jgi:hypothetical protein
VLLLLIIEIVKINKKCAAFVNSRNS